MMRRRTIDQCGWCGVPTWCAPQGRRGTPTCRACDIERYFDHVLYRPLGFRLLAWQRDVLRRLYGTPLSVDQDIRKYREAYIEVPKKNGKSFLVGGLPIYALDREAQDNDNFQAFGVAGARAQARIVFDAAVRLIKANPLLLEDFKLLDSTSRILKRGTNAVYRVISADGDLQDGLEPSLTIMDELHVWKTPKAKTLYQVLTKGTIARAEPMTVAITTAGRQHDSPVCWPQHVNAMEVLQGKRKEGRRLNVVYAADPKRLEADPGYWKSRQARVDANPSHEDLGGFLPDDAIAAEIDNAEATGQVSSAKRYHLNVWELEESETPVIRLADWDACGEHGTRSLMGRPCFAGMDLSRTTDLTALVLVFPSEDGVDILPFFWMPRGAVARLEARDHQQYTDWIAAGRITACPGAEVDTAYVRDKVAWAAETFDLKEVCYDPWNAHQLTADLESAGLMMVKTPQTPSVLSAGTKRLLALIYGHNLRHDNCPVMRWQANCARVIADSNDNIKFCKPKGQEMSRRIDGFSALANAMTRVVAAQRDQPSLFWTPEVV